MYKSTGIESCLLNFPDVVDIIIFPCHILMIFDFIIYIGNFADVPFIIFISKVWPWRHLTKGHRASHNVLRRTQIPGPPCSKLRWLKTHTHCMKITIRSYQIISDHICHICHIKSMEKKWKFQVSKTSNFLGHSAGFFLGNFAELQMFPGLGEPSFRTAAYLPVRILSRCPGE